MQQALYRKWRPRDFNGVIGQDQVTSILKYECKTGQYSHAYLFCGSRGTGKTSCAKILAKAVNCENPSEAGPCCQCASCLSIDSGAATDVLELDAASNNSVDDIRNILDEVSYAPSSLKYRVYIIDEVHMLSASAFNALLKTLEEPPSHVVFILATTEMQKLPSTIVSRCQHFDFKRISTPELTKHLLYIASREGIDLTDDAAVIIARQAIGGMRDAISLLDLCAAAHLPVTPELVRETTGAVGREGVRELVTYIAKADYAGIYGRIHQMVISSVDLNVFWNELISYYRDMIVLKNTQTASEWLDLTDAEFRDIQTLSGLFTKEKLLYHVRLLQEAAASMRQSAGSARAVAEVTLTRMCDPMLDTSPEAILARLSVLEQKIASGVALSQPVPSSGPVTGGNAGNGRSGHSAVPETSGTASGTAQTAGTEVPAGRIPSAGPENTAAPVGKTPMVGWADAIEQAKQSDVMLASFLSRSCGYTLGDGKILIETPDEFTMNMFMKDENFEAVRRAMSLIAARPIDARNLLIQVQPQPTEDKTRAFPDEILNYR